MKDLLALLGGFLFLIYVGSQVGCLLDDILEDKNKDEEEES